jgi:type II secretion system protein N
MAPVRAGAMSPARDGSARVPWRSAAAYALYAVVAAGLFLVLTFPYERLQAALVAGVARSTHARVTVESGRFLFPLGVGWRGVRFEPAGDRGRLLVPFNALTVDAVRIRVALWPLLRRTVDADIAWEAYGGRSRGTWVSRPAPGGARFALDQVGQGFELARLPFLPPGDWRGTLRLDLTCRWTNEAWWTGEGAGSAEVTGLRIDGLTVAGVPLNGIEFDTIAAQIALKGGTVTVQRFAAGGALGTTSGEGTVLVRMPWSESILNLTLKLSPSAGAAARVPLLALAGTRGGPITVHIGGRLGRPDVTLNGTPIS